LPYVSDAQRKFFNANRERLAAQGVDVDEWNNASRGKKLPARKKKAMSQSLKAAAESLEGAGFSPETIDGLLAQLTMLQHHIDDAEVYGAQGRQDAAQGSLDDAEENTEAVAEQVLPPAKAEVVEDVGAQGDKEEEAAGVQDEDAEKEARANDAFEVGLRYTFHKQGFDASRIEALVDVAKGLASGAVKTASDIHATMVPHALAAQHLNHQK
jgi:hypothetical protein